MTKEVKMVLGVVAVVVVFTGIGLLLLKQQNNNLPKVSSDKSEALTRSTPNMRGKTDSTIKIIEFGDIQCPACAAANPLMDELYKQYGDRVSFTFRHFPLPMHKNAYAGADAAEAAGEQGRFFEMVTKMYEVQLVWSETGDPSPTFQKLAQELGLNMDQFNKAYTDKTHRNRIDQDKADGEYLEVAGTPTFYVNGEQILDGGPAQVKSKIDELLKNSSAQTTSDNTSTMEITPDSAPNNSGKHDGFTFGYIRTMKANAITFDEAKWLGAEEADKASKEDNGCNKPNPPANCSVPNGFTPNGFYIQNKDTDTQVYTLNQSISIKLIQLGSNPGVGIKTGTLADLEKNITQFPDTPFWIKLDGKTIIHIEEQYIP